MRPRILTAVAATLTTLGVTTASLLVAPVTAVADSDVDAKKGRFTRVAVAPAFYQKLQNNRITPSPTDPASLFVYEGTPAFRFPIVEASNNDARLEHVGGIRFARGDTYATIKAFTIKARQGKVSAKIVISGERPFRDNVFLIRKSNRPRLGDVRLVLNRSSANGLNFVFDTNNFDAYENVGFASVVRRSAGRGR